EDTRHSGGSLFWESQYRAMHGGDFFAERIAVHTPRLYGSMQFPSEIALIEAIGDESDDAHGQLTAMR
ncbi:MAG TPA: hypothetical protein VFW59_07010, partial [Gallionella sp.]|nr:hypothetical protein [Gallionella sp.]